MMNEHSKATVSTYLLDDTAGHPGHQCPQANHATHHDNDSAIHGQAFSKQERRLDKISHILSIPTLELRTSNVFEERVQRWLVMVGDGGRKIAKAGLRSTVQCKPTSCNFTMLSGTAEISTHSTFTRSPFHLSSLLFSN